MNSMAQNEQRAAYIAGLRKIADALEADPSLPYPGEVVPQSLSVQVKDRAGMAAWVALLDGDATATEEAKGGNYYVRGRVGGVDVLVYALTARLGGRSMVRTFESFEVEPFLTGAVA